MAPEKCPPLHTSSLTNMCIFLPTLPLIGLDSVLCLFSVHYSAVPIHLVELFARLFCVFVYNFKDTFQTKDQLIGDGMPKREQKTIFGSVVKGLGLDK